MTLPAKEVKRALLDETLRLMETGGLDAVKARALASSVGISVGTIYNLYGNIDGLIEAACSEILHGLNETGQKAIAAFDAESGGAKMTVERLSDRFMVLADTYLDFVVVNEKRWTAMLAFNRGRNNEEASTMYLELQDELFDLIGSGLAGTSLGVEVNTMRQAARALWSSVHGIVSMNYVGQASDETLQNTRIQIELLVRYFLRGLLGSTNFK